MTAVQTEGPAEMERRWDICRSVIRWSLMRYRNDMPSDPRRADWFVSTMQKASLRDHIPTEGFARRVIVLRAIATWMSCVEKRNSKALLDGRRIAIEAEHSALLWWLFHGNDLLPHPPPLRMSRPDHLMAVTGSVRAFEVWREPNMGIDACVDQHMRGWKYISGSDKEGRFKLSCQHWGIWEFVRGSENRVSPSGHPYVLTWWDGKRVS